MTTKHLSILFYLGLICTPAVAQTTVFSTDRLPSHITNATLTNSGSNKAGNMNSTAALTIPDWYVSHGTPVLFTDVPPDGGQNSVWMWSYSGRGEGIYTHFGFRKGSTYRVCIWVKNTNQQTAGRLMVKAVNGLRQDFSTMSSNMHTKNAQLISDTYTYSADWRQEMFDFTADEDYTQLQVFPFRSQAAARPADQYEVAVGRISVIEIPAALPGTIEAACGSNVSVSSDVSQPFAMVEWTGPEGLYVKGPVLDIADIRSKKVGRYEMKISVSSGGVFTHEFDIRVPEICLPANEYEIFPNPSVGQLFIKDPLLEILQIDVLTPAGRLMHTMNPPEGGNVRHLVDISGLSPGNYIIKIVTAKTNIAKIVVLQ